MALTTGWGIWVQQSLKLKVYRYKEKCARQAIKLSKHDLQIFSKVATVDLEKGCTAGVFHPAVTRSIANSL
jgi:hypothetical protein